MHQEHYSEKEFLRKYGLNFKVRWGKIGIIRVTMRYRIIKDVTLDKGRDKMQDRFEEKIMI